jgi:hypothetical protein
MRARLKSPALVDLRNVYEPKLARSKGFLYSGVGR